MINSIEAYKQCGIHAAQAMKANNSDTASMFNTMFRGMQSNETNGFDKATAQATYNNAYRGV
jgi:hypothetical protein